MKCFNRLAKSTCIVLMIAVMSTISMPEIVKAKTISNLNFQLQSIDGTTVSTRAYKKPRIIVFFNIGCHLCEDVETELRKGYNESGVDLIFAESSPSNKPSLDETKEFYNDLGIKAKAYCYDASDACIEYKKACGCDGTVFKPIIIYISADNKIKKYTTGSADIFKSAEQCSIPLAVKGTYISKTKRWKKKIKVYWKSLDSKNAKMVTGYQIRWSRKSNMKGYKIRTISGRTNLHTTIKKLKRKTKYYVQVRTYRKIRNSESYDMVTYHSSWSSKKTIKTK